MREPTRRRDDPGFKKWHEGEILTLSAEELELGYRTSNVVVAMLVLSGTLSLKEGDPSEIKKQMDEYSMARKTSLAYF